MLTTNGLATRPNDTHNSNTQPNFDPYVMTGRLLLHEQVCFDRIMCHHPNEQQTKRLAPSQVLEYLSSG